MSQRVARRWQCEECGSREFERDAAGFYVCSSCGVQRQQAEEKAELDDAQQSSRRRLQLLRLPAASSASAAQLAASDPIALSLRSSRLLLDSFHFLLRRQTDWLVKRCSAPPQLYGVVGRVWLGLLRWWQQEGWGADAQHMLVFMTAVGVRKNQSRRRIEELLRRREQGSSGHQEEKEGKEGKEGKEAVERKGEAAVGAAGRGGEEEAQREQRVSWELEDGSDAQAVGGETREQHRRRVKRELKGAAALGVAELSMPLSLAVLFLSLQLCRQPLTMHLLLSLARIDQLPYLAFVRPGRLPPRLLALLPSAPDVMTFFRPSVIPGARTLLALASHLTQRLGLSPSPGFQLPTRNPRRGTAASLFSLHSLTFSAPLTAMMYCRQLHVPEALTGLVLGMLPLWQSSRAEESEGEGGLAAVGRRRQHDEVSVLLCVLLVLKMVYGLDREPETGQQSKGRRRRGRKRKRGEDAVAAEGGSALSGDDSGMRRGEHSEEGEELRAAASDSRMRGAADAGFALDEEVAAEEEEGRDQEEKAGRQEDSASAAGDRPRVVEARRWSSRQSEESDLASLLQMQREEEEERLRKQKEAEALTQHCALLCRQLAASTAPADSSTSSPSPPSLSTLDAELVRLLHPPLFFPSSYEQARRFPVEDQPDLLRFWNDAVLPPSLAADDFTEFVDKIKALAPQRTAESASAASSRSEVSSLFSLLSESLPASSPSLHFSRVTMYYPGSSGRFHPDYELVLYAGSLLCGERMEWLDRRLRRFALRLYWIGKGRRLHSVGWRRGSRVEELRRRRRKRQLQRRLRQQADDEEHREQLDGDEKEGAESEDDSSGDEEEDASADDSDADLLNDDGGQQR